MLVGREAEQRTLNALLDRAREERSAVLVLRGAPGIGKTALLDYAQERADGMQLLRCAGIEAEHELPFAGMHQLVHPSLDLIDRLPDPQAAAMRSALGLSDEVVENRFLVSLGLLSLLAEASEEGPVLCCIDDAQWLDRPSAEAFAFSARRLEAEPIAMLMTVREGEGGRFEAPGAEELELGGLDDAGARELLGTRLDPAASPEVVESLLASAEGNPLALLELPTALSEAQLEGSEPILGPLPVRGAIEEQFRARAASLPEDAWRVLLLATADEAGDLDTVRRAAERLGLSASDLELAAGEGLVELDGALAFRHPLVRSAVYGSAPREERKAAHEALAAVLDDPVRSAWHRAAVADRADEEIAGELEAAAGQAEARGASVTASAAFERAAELTEDDERRGRRLRCAAQASLDAGRLEVAAALVERARPLVGDPAETLQLTLVNSAVQGRRGSLAESYELVKNAGAAIADAAPEMAFELALWSLMASFQGGWADRVAPDIQRTVERIGEAGGLEAVGRPLMLGVTRLAAGDAAGARGPLVEARETAVGLISPQPGYAPGPPRSGESEARRAGTLTTMAGFTYFLTAEFAGARALISKSVSEHRERGALIRMAGAMGGLAFSQVGDRHLREAAATVAEGLEMTRQAGFDNDQAALLASGARVAALQGREADCREAAEGAMRYSLPNGIGWATNNARVALAELELVLGNPRETVDELGQLTSAYFQPMAPLAVPDLIDAALRLGERERAEESLRRLEAWAPVSGAPQVREIVGRSRAVMAEDPAEADRLFAEVLEGAEHEVPPYERARTHLAAGERLRRERRKSEARAHLRTAMDTFEGLGAKPWAERARGELNATGEKARKRDASTLDDLTPQELRIAELVAAGATNREVAAQLFVSPKTVEYHLRKVFLKLGVNSRVELARVPLGQPAAERDGGGGQA
jgi:DNA-binding CsgD family transcriptional regulator